MSCFFVATLFIDRYHSLWCIIGLWAVDKQNSSIAKKFVILYMFFIPLSTEFYRFINFFSGNIVKLVLCQFNCYHESTGKCDWPLFWTTLCSLTETVQSQTWYNIFWSSDFIYELVALTSTIDAYPFFPVSISVIMTPRAYMSILNVISPLKNSGAKYPLHEKCGRSLH